MQNEMRDRLIKLIKKVPYGVSVGATFEQHFCEKVADHLIENGVILPPCKVGDTVYSIIAECNAPYNYCPYNGGYGTTRCDKEPCKAYVKESKFDVSDLENIGKTVFLTREEAEKKLEEMSK